MQTTDPNPTTPILNLTADHPVLSSPNSIVDLTKAASSTALSSKNTFDPFRHHAVVSPHASSSNESDVVTTQKICYLVKVVDPVNTKFTNFARQ